MQTEVATHICRHSGKLGDIVYSLAGVKAFASADILLSCGSHMSVEVASSLLPLLKEQPYIQRAEIWNGEIFDFDLDIFRKYGIGYNLADAHLIPLGLPPTCRPLAKRQFGDYL